MKEKKLYKIAFMGDKDHGRDIISTLESWGGSNYYLRIGSDPEYIYFINDLGTIDLIHNSASLSEEMKNFYFLFWHDYNIECHLKVGETINYGGQNYDVDGILFDANNRCIVYKLKSFGIGVEYITNNELTPTEEYQTEQCEEMVKDNFVIKAPTIMDIEFDLTKYSYEVKDGKIVISEKKPVYPKTYEECAKIMNCPIDGPSGWLFNFDANIKNTYYRKKDILMGKFIRLLICRDAYWKIAGEEMGLGKPWEPYEEDELFIICNNRISGVYKSQGICTDNFILSFPTEEIRDAFFKNFKKEIEQCKELL